MKQGRVAKPGAGPKVLGNHRWIHFYGDGDDTWCQGNPYESYTSRIWQVSQCHEEPICMVLQRLPPW